jgi:hypothetical protein
MEKALKNASFKQPVNPNRYFYMGKGNNAHKKEVKKPKKEKPKVLATRKSS